MGDMKSVRYRINQTKGHRRPHFAAHFLLQVQNRLIGKNRQLYQSIPVINGNYNYILCKFFYLICSTRRRMLASTVPGYSVEHTGKVHAVAYFERVKDTIFIYLVSRPFLR